MKSYCNRNYILKRIEEKQQLIEEIAQLEAILKSDSKIKKIIIKELENVIKKYAKPRKSEIRYGMPEVVVEEKAEEKAEKEEAEEERLEAIREEKRTDECEEDSDELFDALQSEGVNTPEGSKEEIKQEVEKMMNEMKLLVEDLKGAAVDEQL